MAEESKTPYSLKAQGSAVKPDQSDPKLLSWQYLAKAQKFRVVMPREIHLQLEVLDGDGHSLPGRKFEFTQAGKTHGGVIDEKGLLEAFLLSGEETTLLVHDGPHTHEYKLELGPMEKPETARGAQQRLASLGYDVQVNGVDDQNFKRALAAFQFDHSLPSAKLADLAGPIDAAYQGK
jgi:hypothetical protein